MTRFTRRTRARPTRDLHLDPVDAFRGTLHTLARVSGPGRLYAAGPA
jgi:hypothetical protein